MNRQEMEALAQERRAVLERARELAPYAAALIDAAGGPSPLAHDQDALGLALAAANRRWLRASWCPGHRAGTAYFCDLRTGAHGWMCTECLGLVQLG